MKTFLKYFLFLFLLALISVGITLFLKKPKEQIVQQEANQLSGSSEEFPQVGDSDREEALPAVPTRPKQNDSNSDEDQTKDLIGAIKSSYALDNWVDIKTPFRWAINGEGVMNGVTVAGQGFSADSNQPQAEEIENFLKTAGFHFDSANAENGVNVSIKGFQKENEVCLVIKTTPKGTSQFDAQDQSIKLEMRCGLIK